MNKYGADNFSFEIIEKCEKDKLSDREKYWITYYNSTSPNGYNLTKGGDGGNTFQYRTKEQMQETKKKISQVTSGVNNGFYGKHHSDKTKDYLRKINLGKRMSEETKRKLSESLQGHYMPKHAKQKISNATKKQWEDENFKKLMSNINKGNKYAQGNKWNKNRIDVFHPDTLEHKRILEQEIKEYINNGFVKGIPPNDARYFHKIKKCTNENLIGVSFNKENNMWMAYINYQKKRYGAKLFQYKQDAIKHRIFLENIFEYISEHKIDMNNIDIKQTLQKGEIVLWAT